MAARQETVRALLREHGTTYAEEVGINLGRETPSALFRLLCASLLFGARISAASASKAARALSKAGWTTAQRMSDATWSERAQVLNQNGYARYDERTSSMLGDTAQMLVERYGGDLRRLREAAKRQPASERRLLKEFKGIGDVSVDIFFREAQAVWDELRPFADARALAAARQLDLGDAPAALAELVPAREYPRLVAALVRVDLARDYQKVLSAAG